MILTELIYWQSEDHTKGQSFVMGDAEELGVIFWHQAEPTSFRATGRDITIQDMEQIVKLLKAHETFCP